MFLLESPHRGDSNEYKQYTIFIIKMKIDLNDLKSAAMGYILRDSSTSLNCPSVFEPMKFYCTCISNTDMS